MQIIAYPTIKIPANNELSFKELETVLNQVQVLPFTRRNNTASAEDWTLRPSISLSTMMTAAFSTKSCPLYHKRCLSKESISMMTSRLAPTQPSRTSISTGRRRARSSTPWKGPLTSSFAGPSNRKSRKLRGKDQGERNQTNVESTKKWSDRLK